VVSVDGAEMEVDVLQGNASPDSDVMKEAHSAAGSSTYGGVFDVDRSVWPEWMKKQIMSIEGSPVMTDGFRLVLEKFVELEASLGFPKGQVRRCTRISYENLLTMQTGKGVPSLQDRSARGDWSMGQWRTQSVPAHSGFCTICCGLEDLVDLAAARIPAGMQTAPCC